MTFGPIISLSLPKSGTTTLATALRHAGLKVADWRIRRHETDNKNLHDQLIAPIMYEDYFESGDPLKRLAEFDAVTEMNAVNKKISLWPQTDSGLLLAIEKHHPKARFVLSRRDAAKAANSILTWNNLGKERLPRNDVPGLPRPFGGTLTDLQRWIEGHYGFCERLFAGTGKLLSYQLDDPDVQSKISDFIGVDLPWWGQSNSTSEWLATQRLDG